MNVFRIANHDSVISYRLMRKFSATFFFLFLDGDFSIKKTLVSLLVWHFASFYISDLRYIVNRRHGQGHQFQEELGQEGNPPHVLSAHKFAIS